MGNERQPKPPTQTTPTNEPPKAEPPKHTERTVAQHFQPIDQTQADFIRDLRMQGETLIEAEDAAYRLPNEVADAMLPMPTLRACNLSLSPADYKDQDWPDGHTYDGKPGLGVYYGPTLTPIYQAFHQLHASTDTNQRLYDASGTYLGALTHDLGKAWKIFQEERARSNDDQQIGWDDVLSDKTHGNAVHASNTQVLNTATAELDSINKVQHHEQEMIALLSQLSTLNSELEIIQTTQAVEQTKEALDTKSAEAKAKEDNELALIEGILSFGLSVAADPTATTAVMEGSKALTKGTAKTLHTHLFKTDDLLRLQAEVDRLSKQHKRLKNHLHDVQKTKVVKDIRATQSQVNILIKAAETADGTRTKAEQASTSALAAIDQSVQTASTDLQTCADVDATCTPQQGALRSMQALAQARLKVSQSSPQILQAADAHLALQQRLQLSARAQQGIAFVNEHGPKFKTNDPALAKEYTQFRESSVRSRRLFQVWQEQAECEAHNARELSSHVRNFKGQKALIEMQTRLSGDITAEHIQRKR